MELTQPPAPGASWGYPDATPASWGASTDLPVCHLPVEHWQHARSIAPTHFRLPEENGNGNGQPAPPPRRHLSHPALVETRFIASQSSAPLSASQSSALLSASQPSATATPSAKPDPVVFPKPACRRFLDFLARYPFIEPQSSSDCGAACLAMISQYWGKRFTLNYLRELACGSLPMWAGRCGPVGGVPHRRALPLPQKAWDSTPVRASLNKLEERTNPWIAHREGIHYIVV